MSRTPENCVEILSPFAERYGDDPKVVLFGGIGSAALKDPKSTLDSQEGIIVPGDDFYVPTIRDNGTKRDVDVLVVSTDLREVEEVKKFLEGVVDGRLDVSVFSIRRRAELMEVLARSFGAGAIKYFLSDRYVTPFNTDGTYVKALPPFSMPIDPDSLVPWKLEISDYISLHVPNPGVTVANYTNRSCSGVREKDAGKLTEMIRILQQKAPEVIEWMYDGPGKSQLELAQLIHSAGVGMQPLNDVLPFAMPQLSKSEIREHEGFMFGDQPLIVQMAILAMFALKANALRTAESSEAVRKAWQLYFERGVAAGIVSNS